MRHASMMSMMMKNTCGSLGLAGLLALGTIGPTRAAPPPPAKDLDLETPKPPTGTRAPTGKDLVVEPPADRREDRKPRRGGGAGSLAVDVWIEGGAGTIQVEDEIQIRMKASEPSYLYLVNIGSSGTVTVLHPFKAAGHRRTGGDEPVIIPGDGKTIRVRGPAGRDHLLALASRERLQIHPYLHLLDPVERRPTGSSKDLVYEESEAPERSGVEDAVETLILKLEARHHLETGDLAHMLRTVDVEDDRSRKPTLTVKVRPSGARICVDGSATWRSSPHTWEDLAAGPHEIVIMCPGYRSRLERVELKSGTGQTLDVDLEPLY